MHDCGWPVPLHFLKVFLHEACNMGENLKINGNGIFNTRPLDLDHHLGTVLHGRPVNLADGCGGKGGLVKAGKELFRITAQFLLEDGNDLFIGKRRHLILEFGQFGEIFRGNKIGPGGQQLAEFDKGRPQFLHRHPQSFLTGKPLDLGSGLAVDHLQTRFKVLVDMQTINQVFKAIFKQNLQDTMVSVQVPVGTADDAKFAYAEQ